MEVINKKRKIGNWQSWDFSDSSFGNVTINVKDGSLRAHKDVLSTYSKFFNALFNNGMKESGSDTCSLSEETVESLRLFLEAIYDSHSLIDLDKDISLHHQTVQMLHQYDAYPPIIEKYDLYFSTLRPVSWDTFLVAEQCQLTRTLLHCIFNFDTLWPDIEEEKLSLLSSRTLSRLILDRREVSKRLLAKMEEISNSYRFCYDDRQKIDEIIEKVFRSES